MRKNSAVDPKHYQVGGIQVFAILRAKLTKEELVGCCKSNVLKYIFRADKKNGVEDYQKAAWYLQRLIEIKSSSSKKRKKKSFAS